MPDTLLRSGCELTLSGLRACSFSSVLSALGIFRLVAEQWVPGSTLRWEDGVPRLGLLCSATADDLVAFMVDRYEPTPIVTPWNGGSGFYPGDNSEALEFLAISTSKRLAEYRRTITIARRIVDRLVLNPAASSPGKIKEAIAARRKEAKTAIQTEARSTLPDACIPWVDAALVLGDDKAKYPEILGSGGNDGRLDFANNFMQRLVAVLPLEGTQEKKGGHPNAISESLLRSILFGAPTRGLIGSTGGVFSPGSVGGANSSVGFEADSLSNPWEFILVLEGAVMFAGAVTRRLGDVGRSQASYPFHANGTGAGFASASGREEQDGTRAEIWVPQWENPASLAEVKCLFSEGRVQIGSRPARRGVDFARAAASLGIDRGISAFSRFSLLKRNGDAYLAVHAGTFQVRERPAVDFLRIVDGQIEDIRARLTGNKRPARFGSALRRYDEAVIGYCRQGTERQFTDVLGAIGAIERELAVAPGLASSLGVRPLSLSDGNGASPSLAQWAEHAMDGSAETQLCCALASLWPTIDGKETLSGGRGHPWLPLRAYLEPVEFDFRRREWNWALNSGRVCGGDIRPESLLARVLARRILDLPPNSAQGEGERRAVVTERHQAWGAVAGSQPPSLEAIDALISGELAWDRFLDLLWGFALCRARIALPRGSGGIRLPESLPRAYGLLKLALAPYPVSRPVADRWDQPAPGPEVSVLPEPGILALLRAGEGSRAVDLAVRRLIASGLPPVSRSLPVPRDSTRLAASLLVPVSSRQLAELASLVIRPADADDSKEN